jgi:hypothetical protein
MGQDVRDPAQKGAGGEARDRVPVPAGVSQASPIPTVIGANARALQVALGGLQRFAQSTLERVIRA